jgi:hypothetical protein
MGNKPDSDQVPILDKNINSPDNILITQHNYSNDSVHKYETTVTKITEVGRQFRRFQIYCNPDNDTLNFELRKDHPNFINLYNKLIIGNTYTFITEKEYFLGMLAYVNSGKIIDILPPETHTITTLIKGFLNVKNELSINDYSEIVPEKINDKVRMLISNDNVEKIIIGHTYKISYVKDWRSNLYRVVDYELQ